MNRVKQKINEYVNFFDVVKRIKENRGLSDDKEVAVLLGLSPQDLVNRRKKGTILNLVVAWGINEKVNLHWLLSGETQGTPLAEERRGENSVEEGGDMERIKQAASVLGSETIYSKLLSNIIKSFFEEWERERVRPIETGQERKT